MSHMRMTRFVLSSLCVLLLGCGSTLPQRNRSGSRAGAALDDSAAMPIAAPSTTPAVSAPAGIVASSSSTQVGDKVVGATPATASGQAQGPRRVTVLTASPWPVEVKDGNASDGGRANVVVRVSETVPYCGGATPDPNDLAASAFWVDLPVRVYRGRDLASAAYVTKATDAQGLVRFVLPQGQYCIVPTLVPQPVTCPLAVSVAASGKATLLTIASRNAVVQPARRDSASLAGSASPEAPFVAIVHAERAAPLQLELQRQNECNPIDLPRRVPASFR